MAKFELAPLPYEFGALEPHIDAQTMQIHHDKHHATYVNNLNAALEKYPNLQRLIWVQEEPLNMGAWNYLRPRLRQLTEDRLPIHYVGRPESSSPAEGSSTAYRTNQQALIEQAFKFDEQAHTRSVVKERG